MRLLNPEPAVRTEGADRLAVELYDASRELPHSAERFRKLIGSLHHIDATKIAGDDTRTAFWINVYNALRFHVFHLMPPHLSVPLSLSRFRAYGWRIGAHDYSLSIIHHGLLRRNRPSLWNRRPMLAARDPRLEAAPRVFDPRIHFALAFGAQSAPPPRRFVSGDLDKQLAQAERDYVTERTAIQESGGRPILLIPELLRAYRADFGLANKQQAIDWVIERLPDAKRLSLLPRRDKIIAPWKLLVFHWAFRPGH